MKITLKRKIKVDYFNHLYGGKSFILGGFYEKEPGYLDGPFIISEDDTLHLVITIKELSVTLEQLNLISNDLYHNPYDYKTQKLEYEQYSKIKYDLDYLIIPAIKRENPALNDKQISLIYSAAYDKGHSGGVSEIICQCFDYIEFAKEIIQAK
jgi:hypothetical protein